MESLHDVLTMPVLIVYDRDLEARGMGAKAFYIRVYDKASGNIDFVDLDSCVSVAEARNRARAMGHNPTCWKEIKNDMSTIHKFY